MPLSFGGQVIRLDESLRRWEPKSEIKVQEVMSELLRPGDCVLDVGANFGLHSLLAAKLVGPMGKVCAFEPLPENLKRLRRNVVLNRLEKVIQVVPSAVSNSPERYLSFFSGAENLGLTASLMRSSANSKKQVVANLRLDDFAGSIRRRVRLVKIDVEGAELDVLRGAQLLLKRDLPLLIIEVHAYMFADLNIATGEFEGFLASMGYRQEVISGTTIRQNVHYQILSRPISTPPLTR